MNKLFLYVLSLTVIFAIVSCENNISDEQFIKKVSLTKNGLQTYDIEYTDEGIVNLSIPVNINGTSMNAQDVQVKLALDKDTLDAYNFERYRYNKELYFLALEENMYFFPNGPETTIPAGKDYGIIPLQINLNNFNLYNNYILPLCIESVSAYGVAQSRYSKLLIDLNISNFISGTYSISGSVWEEATPDQKLLVSSKTLFTLDSNKCYLYMGDVEEEDNQRAEYTLTITVDKDVYEDRIDEVTGARIRKFTKITLGTLNTDKELKQEGDAWVEQERTDDPYDNKLENLLTRIYMKYSYTDLNDPEYSIRKVFEGTLSHTQSIGKDTGKVVK